MNRKNQQIAKYWDKRAVEYDRNSLIAGMAYPQILDAVKAQLMTDDHVLDIGSGTGGFTIQYIDLVKQVTCCDIAPKMLAISRQRLADYHNVDFSLQDCTNLKFNSNNFDVVLCINVLHQMNKPEKAIREFQRVLRSDGRLIAISVAQKEINLLKKIGIAFRYSTQFGIPPATHSFNLQSLSEMITDCGFKVSDAAIITRDPFPVACVTGVK